ncbi:unnamed protein product [Spirodela intermedia]|uniref:Uncharacterized protein n=1 Tax=Spirodela intermedia TaxID=51605 RepID=A0A7I8LKC9_SPIIN|nr:unnamed protein product [Spirodela intermedia]
MFSISSTIVITIPHGKFEENKLTIKAFYFDGSPKMF